MWDLIGRNRIADDEYALKNLTRDLALVNSVPALNYSNVGFWWQTAAETRDYIYAGAVLEREISERLTLGAELLGNSPKGRGSRSDVAFNLGGAWKVSKHVNLLFTGGRDIVGETSAMVYIGLQLLTK